MASTTATSNHKSNAKNANGARGSADLNTELENPKHEVSTILETLSRLGGAGVEEAVAQSRGLKEKGPAKGEEIGAEIAKRATDLEAKASDFVRKNPLQTVGLAIGAGFMAALLLRKK